MNARMAGQDHSLNSPLKSDTFTEWQDWIEDKQINQEERLEQTDEYKYRKTILINALTTLNEREKYIFEQRRLNEDSSTLDDLSKKFNISRERVRQIEVRAFEKVQAYIKQFMKDKGQQKLIEDRSMV